MFVYDGSAYQRFDWFVSEVDSRGRITSVSNSRGGTEQWAWLDCCSASSYTDTAGVKTIYNRDPLGRLVEQRKEGIAASGSYAAQPDLITTYERAVENGLYVHTKTLSSSAQSSPSLAHKTRYDAAGRVVSTVDETNLTTSFVYSSSAGGGLIRSTLHADETTTDEQYYRDGRLKQVTGTAALHSFTDYGVNTADATSWTKRYSGPLLGSSPRWMLTTYNALDQLVEEERPGYDGSSVVSTYEYNALGQLWRELKTGQAPRLHAYDELARPYRSGLDLNDNDQLDLASTDRITEQDHRYALEGSDWWLVDTQRVYAVDNSSTATTVSIRKQRLTGLATGAIEEVRESNVHGLTTTTTRVVDRSASAKSDIHVINYPDSGVDAQTELRNGLTQSRTSKEGHATRYAYDELGRAEGEKDPRHGNWSSRAYNSLGQVASETDAAGNSTTYGYSATTGRLTSVTNAQSKVTYYDYTSRGELWRTWGHVPYPVEYAYDDYGQKWQMKTYQNGTGWAASTWPAATTGTASVTEWVFEPATGLLTEKKYIGDSNPTTKTTYTYTDEGKLHSRRWQRTVGGNPLDTIYSYDPDTGDLTDVDYSDNTPDVAYTYNRQGRQRTISDVVGTRTLDYNATLQLQTEDIVAGQNGLYSKLVTRNYQPTGDQTGKDIGLSIGTSQDPDADYWVTYHYEDTVSSVATGRLSKITGTGLPNAGVTYTYVPNSNLVNKHEFRTGSSTVVLDALRTHEPNRDLLTQVKNTLYTTTPQVSQYDYVNDSVARRTSMALSGSMFSASHFFAWGYNDRNELTSADQFLGTPSSPGNRFTQYGDYDYAYDNIGNRDSYRLDADPATTYTPNEFNQYTSTANPAESFEYDEDGNLTEDGSRSYGWDAENRLVEVVPLAPANGDKKVRFRYDYMGRRVRKEVFTYANGWPANPGEVQHFVYDNWNVVLVMNGLSSNQTVRKYTWGLDLSGLGGTSAPAGIHGAGGIGGLLACQATFSAGSWSSFWYTYDANGNVVQVIDGTAAPTVMAAAAKYEYDPYGNTIAAVDLFLNNPFRFSTKWFDSETGLGYWGHRYYLTGAGRWASRDPIEEKGGDNIYGFVRNASTQATDPHGLSCLACLFGPCCNNQPYEPETECCEKDRIVQKVKMWRCIRPLNITGSWVVYPLPMAYHEYVCCKGPNKDCYGKQSSTKVGQPIPREDPATGDCREVMVCPATKRSHCNSPVCTVRYGIPFGEDCQEWAEKE